MNDKTLQKNLIELLHGRHAHLNLDDALKGLKSKFRNVPPDKGLHTIWMLLEHIRISQEDILRYTLDPDWQSPPWPEGYWTKETNDISDEEWEDSIKKFNNDLEELIQLVKNKEDITSELPHGEGRTYLRQVLISADHNSYHIGQIISTRKMLGDWEV